MIRVIMVIDAICILLIIFLLCRLLFDFGIFKTKYNHIDNEDFSVHITIVTEELSAYQLHELNERFINERIKQRKKEKVDWKKEGF